MNSIRSRYITLCAGLLAFAAASVTAQTTVSTGDLTARTAGEREFTLGGVGASNRDFDDSFGGVAFSYGWYSNDAHQWVLRQTINYSNPAFGGQDWNGSTRIAFDYHLAPMGAFRPFVGINAGGVYGDRVRDTLAAGLEGGGKWYVQSRTFIFALIEYGWFFREAHNVDETFDDGQFTWTVGIGFNF